MPIGCAATPHGNWHIGILTHWHITTLFLLFWIFFLSLPCIGSQPLLIRKNAIKRESGVNPEQSRCCKFHTLRCEQPTFSHWKETSGKAPATGTSQKTCRATNFTAFEEKALSLMNRTIRLSFHSSLWFRESMFKLINSAKVYLACPVEGISPGHF